MSEDSGEKNQKATPKKIRDARQKGQVNQSQDVIKLLILAVVAETALLLSDRSMRAMEEMVAFPIERMQQPFTRALQEVLAQAGGVLLGISLITVGLAIGMRLLGSWMQFGFLFAPEALKPDFNRLNPVAQAKQMFSGQSLMNLLMGLVKALFIGALVYLITLPALSGLIGLVHSDLQSYWRGLAELFRRVLHISLGVLLVLAALDFALQKYFFVKRLRMSHEEVRKEFKTLEGDPLIKLQRRNLARQLLEQPASKPKPVEEADMLLINPTHFAVALFYRPEETPLPQLIDKGADDQARALIERAKAARVPIIQCVWLARTLYREDIGRFIPRETLQAVAQIYRVLRELDDEATQGVIEMPDLGQS
ncbi:type III secretion system export apparatus subunit SctU [Pseudomonas borbori]